MSGDRRPQPTPTTEPPRPHTAEDLEVPARGGPRSVQGAAVMTTVDERALPGESFTEREIDILCRLADGAYDTEIARALKMSDRTYRRCVTAAQRKLGARTRAHAVALALAAGVIEFRHKNGRCRCLICTEAIRAVHQKRAWARGVQSRRAIGPEVRDRIYARRMEGVPVAQVASENAVSQAVVYKVMRERRDKPRGSERRLAAAEEIHAGT